MEFFRNFIRFGAAILPLGFQLKTREIKTLLVLSILLALEGFEMHYISGSHSRPPLPHKIPLRITYGLVQGRGRALPSFSPNFPAAWIIQKLRLLEMGLVWCEVDESFKSSKMTTYQSKIVHMET